MFFDELNETLSKAVNSYENIIVIGYLNIDVIDPDKDRNNYLSDLGSLKKRRNHKLRI